MARTHRSPDNTFAGVGAVHQTGGSLPIYICNECGRDVVWAESKRTGRKYLANVSRGYLGQRFYIAANVHDCKRPDEAQNLERMLVDYANEPAMVAEVQERLDALRGMPDEDDREAQYDDWAAEQYEARYDEAIVAAWKSAERGEVDRGAYYDTTPLTMRVPLEVDALAVRNALNRTVFARIGETMYAYGSAGGYSTLGRVKDVEPGVVVAESVYHIGD